MRHVMSLKGDSRGEGILECLLCASAALALLFCAIDSIGPSGGVLVNYLSLAL